MRVWPWIFSAQFCLYRATLTFVRILVLAIVQVWLLYVASIHWLDLLNKT